MKFVVLAGAPGPVCATLDDLLQRMGLPAAKAGAEASFAQWHERLFKATELNPQTLTAERARNTPIGKVWEGMALQLVTANLDGSDCLLQAPEACWTLDFWQQIDPQTRFVMVYLPAEASGLGTEAAAQHWLECQKALLHFCAQPAARGRALLVNGQHAVLHPERLAYTLNSQLGLKLHTQDLAHWSPPVFMPASLDALPGPVRAALLATNTALQQASTALLSPSKDLAVVPVAPTSKSSSRGLLGWLGGSNRQLEDALHTARQDLLYANDLVAALARQNDQLGEQSTQLQLLRQQLQTELGESTQEGELLLQQLHQVQEELEQVFLNREELKKQLATAEQAKAAAEKAKAEAEKAKLTAEQGKAAADKAAAEAKAKAEAAEKAKAEAEKGKLAAEQGKAAAEQGKAAADKAAAEAKAKVEAAEKAKLAAEQGKAAAEQGKAAADKAAAEAKAKVEAAEKAKAEAEKGKLAAEQGKAAAEQGKAAADKAAAEATKKAADLAAQLQSSSATLPEQTKALKEAQEESELLLKQLHQVQEELEAYYLKHQEAQAAQTSTQERLTRVLSRLPTWADATVMTATEVPTEGNNRCLRIDTQSLWVADEAAIAHMSFLLGSRDGVPYMEFRPAGQDGKGGVPRQLLPWPEAFKDEQGERLLIAPGAPGAFGQAQAQVVQGLSASQWRLVKGLLVLVGSQVSRLNLRAQADRLHWVNITRDLTQQLEEVSSGVHFQSAEVMAVTQPEAGTEVMRVAIRDLSSRNTRVPLCVFELGIKYKTLKSGPSPQMFFIDFRPWIGAVLPFVNFKPNSKDEQGEFLRISLARTGRNKNNTDAFDVLDASDRVLMKHFGAVFVRLAKERAMDRFATALSELIWVQELDEVGQLMNTRLEQDA